MLAPRRGDAARGARARAFESPGVRRGTWGFDAARGDVATKGSHGAISRCCCCGRDSPAPGSWPLGAPNRYLPRRPPRVCRGVDTAYGGRRRSHVDSARCGRGRPSRFGARSGGSETGIHRICSIHGRDGRSGSAPRRSGADPAARGPAVGSPAQGRRCSNDRRVRGGRCCAPTRGSETETRLCDARSAFPRPAGAPAPRAARAGETKGEGGLHAYPTRAGLRGKARSASTMDHCEAKIYMSQLWPV